MSFSKRLAPRLALTAAIVAAAVSGAGVAFANAGDNAGPKTVSRTVASQPAATSAAVGKPAAKSTAAASAARKAYAAAGHLRTVDWKNAALTLPSLQQGPHCTGGAVKFRNGVATTKNGVYRILGPGHSPVYGQIVGDNRDDAVLPVECGPPDSEYSDHLIAVTGRPGALTVLGGAIKTENWGVEIAGARIAAGEIKVTVKETLVEPPNQPRTQVRGYAWTGQQFQQVSGPSYFPPLPTAHTFDWSTATLTIPFKAGSTIVQPNNRVCPRVTVKFTHITDGVGAVQAGACEYWVHKIATVDLNGDGSADSLVKITATPLGTGELTSGAEWYFAYEFRNGKPTLISFVTAAGLDNVDDDAQPDVTATSVRASIREVRVTQVFRTPGKPNQTLNRTFRWSGGTRFAVDVAAPNPRADLAP